MKKMQMKKISLLTSIVMLLGTVPALNVSAADALSWIVEPTLVCDEVYFDSDIGWLGYNITGYNEEWDYAYGKHGIVGEDGSVILPLEYDYTTSLGHNLVRVTQGDEMKIYDTEGNAEVQFEKYNYNCYRLWGAEDSEYLVTSSSEVNAWLEGLANTAGDEILPQEYDYFVKMNPEKNRICASKNGKCGIMDISGNEIVPFLYSYIEMCDDVFILNDNGTYGMTDYNNNQIVPFEYDPLFVLDEDKKLVLAKKDGKSGVIDYENNVIIPFEYDYLGPVISGTERLLSAGTELDGGMFGKYGIINLNNEAVIDNKYDGLIDCMYSSDVPVLCAEKDGKYGVIDYSENVIIDFEYDDWHDFGDDFLILEKEGKPYIISAESLKAVPVEQSEIYLFNEYNGKSYFITIQDDKYGVVDVDGKVTVQTQYDGIEAVDGTGLCIIEKDNKKGLLNYVSGEELISPQYGGLSVKAEGDDITLAVKDDSGKWGFAKLDISDDPDDCIILRIDSKVAKCYGKQIVNDVAPVIRNERTMLPSRFIAEALGASVEWNPEERKVTITGDNVTIILTIDSDKAYVNGEEETLDSPAFIENDRTYTPVRFICEKLGASVDWDAQSKKVIIK